jgi:hypothetical protein
MRRIHKTCREDFSFYYKTKKKGQKVIYYHHSFGIGLFHYHEFDCNNFVKSFEFLDQSNLAQLNWI